MCILQPDQTDAEIDLNQPFDASSIEYGYISADSKEPIKLYTGLGHNVHIEKEVVLADGTRMFALYQEDGTR